MTMSDIEAAVAARPAETRSPSRSRAVLIALFGCAFVLGTAELVVVGVLPLVAGDLDVPVASAGLLVTAYAFGIAVGGPVLSGATLTLPRRGLLQVSFAAYVGVNALALLAPSLGLLVAIRVATGGLHGLFIGTALALAASVIPPERAGRAAAIVLGGVAAATAFGVPLGTLIGQQLGWRATFVGVVAAGVVGLAGLLVAVPAVAPAGDRAARAQVRASLTRPVLLVLLAAFVVMGGQFVALTFLTPFLQGVPALGPTPVTLVLMGYGIASAIGTLLGGRAADRRPDSGLLVGIVAVVLVLVLLAALGQIRPVLIATVVLWGVAGWALVPILQRKTVLLATAGADFAATLPASAVTGGIALGSVVGGWALAAGGARGPAWAAAAACGLAVPLVWVVTRLRPPVPVPEKRDAGLA